MCEKKKTLRVAVAHTDSSHTSKQIQISLSVYIPQPLHVSLADKHGLLVVSNFHNHGVAVLSADLHHLLLRHTLDRENLFVFFWLSLLKSWSMYIHQ